MALRKCKEDPKTKPKMRIGPWRPPSSNTTDRAMTMAISTTTGNEDHLEWGDGSEPSQRRCWKGVASLQSFGPAGPRNSPLKATGEKLLSQFLPARRSPEQTCHRHGNHRKRGSKRRQRRVPTTPCRERPRRSVPLLASTAGQWNHSGTAPHGGQHTIGLLETVSAADAMSCFHRRSSAITRRRPML
jgi:hypothetical protein